MRRNLLHPVLGGRPSEVQLHCPRVWFHHIRLCGGHSLQSALHTQAVS